MIGVDGMEVEIEKEVQCYGKLEGLISVSCCCLIFVILQNASSGFTVSDLRTYPTSRSTKSTIPYCVHSMHFMFI